MTVTKYVDNSQSFYVQILCSSSGDLKLLHPNVWLNDNVVDLYFKILFGKPPGEPPTFLLSFEIKNSFGSSENDSFVVVRHLQVRLKFQYHSVP